jgi:hypothetical protein
VDEEGLVELRKLTLDKTGTDHVDDPKLDFFTRNVEASGDDVVGEFAVRCLRGKGGEGEETDLAESNGVVDTYTQVNKSKKKGGGKTLEGPTVVINPAVVLIVELLVVLKVSTNENLEESKRLRVSVGKLLYGVKGDQVVELEARRNVDTGLDEAESKSSGLLSGCIGGGDGLESLEKEGVKFTIPGELEISLLFFNKIK